VVAERLTARPYLDQLDRETVGIFDHEGASVAERMWRLEHLHALALELRVHRGEILDAERDVVKRLAAGRHQRSIATPPGADPWPRRPGHRTVSEPHAAGWLANRSDRLERRPASLAVRDLARIPRYSRRVLSARIPNRRKTHTEVLGVPVGRAEGLLVIEM